jgi:hypothetical protein
MRICEGCSVDIDSFKANKSDLNWAWWHKTYNSSYLEDGDRRIMDFGMRAAQAKVSKILSQKRKGHDGVCCNPRYFSNKDKKIMV